MNNLLGSASKENSIIEFEADVLRLQSDAKPAALFVSTLKILRRYLAFIAVWTGAFVAAATLYLERTPPAFTATSAIVLDSKRTGSTPGESSGSSSSPALDNAQAESQIQVIKSERLLSYVFSSLSIEDKAELQPSLPKSALLSELLYKRPENVSQHEGAEGHVRESVAYNNFFNRVLVRRIGQSYVLEISYTSRSPQVARRLANSITSAYLAQQLSFKLAAALNGAEHFQGRVNALQKQVDAANDGVRSGEIPTLLLSDADAKIIGAALEPITKSSPKTTLILASSVVFGVFSAFFMVAVLSGLDRRVISAEQVEKSTAIACLGEFRRRGRFAGNFYAKDREGFNLFVSDYQLAASRVLSAIIDEFGDKRHISLGLASCHDTRSADILSDLFSRILSSIGRDVAIVNCVASRAPDRSFEDGGLNGSKRGRVAGSVEETKGAEPRVQGSIVSLSVQGSATNQARMLLLDYQRLKEIHASNIPGKDVLVVLPPMLDNGDAYYLSKISHGVLLVVESKKDKIDDIVKAVRAFARVKIPIHGFVMFYSKA